MTNRAVGSAVAGVGEDSGGPGWTPTGSVALLAVGRLFFVTLAATRLQGRYRHVLAGVPAHDAHARVVTPALVFYPVVFQMAGARRRSWSRRGSRRRLSTQRQTIQALMDESLTQIDKFPGWSISSP